MLQEEQQDLAEENAALVSVAHQTETEGLTTSTYITPLPWPAGHQSCPAPWRFTDNLPPPPPPLFPYLRQRAL